MATIETTPFMPAVALGNARRSSTRARSFGLCGLLAADGLLAFAPIAVLGPAIGWPASLGNPAAQQLAAIGAHAGEVASGYGLYLLYSLLIAPVMIGVASRTFGGLDRSVPFTVAVFGALSAIARVIGILRWLTAMPVLATAHAAASPVAREQIELVFTAITRYGGGIGEILGVGLFMSVSMGTLGIGAWLHGGMPKWLAGFAVVCAVLLAATLGPAFGGPVLVPVAVAVTALTVWMLAAAAWCLRLGPM